jgi:hypothetical protein
LIFRIVKWFLFFKIFITQRIFSSNFFGGKKPESKNHGFQLFQKHQRRIDSFHERKKGRRRIYYSFHERRGKEESTTVFMKEWAKEPTVISLKLSKNIIENFSHTPNLQLYWGNFEGENFPVAKL